MTATPGIATLPGSTLDSLAALRRDPLDLIGQVIDRCGDLGQFRLGPKRVVVVNDPDLVREVLVDRHDVLGKGDRQLRALRPLLGNGLLTSEGPLHRRQRRAIAPLMHNRVISRWIPPVVELTAAHLRGLGPFPGEVDLLVEMNRLTMRMVGALLLSTVLDGTDDLSRAVTTAFHWEMYALTSAAPLPLWWPSPRSLRTGRALRLIRRRLGELIRGRRATPDGERPEDTLTMLLRLGDGDGPSMSDDLLHDELVTLLGAAQETTADAVTWACYLLAAHPDWLRAARDEVDDVLGGRPVAFADLVALPRCAQVFKEALRLYPPAAVMLRGAAVDTEIGGAPVGRGTTVVVSPYHLHRRARSFPAPERFDPDRFAPGPDRGRHRYAFLPFGAGPHACIGASLALMEGQVILATLLQMVEWEHRGDGAPRPELLINLRPRGGLPVRLRRRGETCALW